MKNVLVTGGAGYIGSVTVKKLLDEGHKVTVLDDLSKGKKEFVDSRAVFIKLNILDLKSLERKLKNKKFDTIMHLAALKDAGESMKNPILYHNNIIGIMNLLNIAPNLKIKQFIFSSSAAVYGETSTSLIDEGSMCDPTNFYGYSKLVGERLLEWNNKLNNLDYVALRYFNVAGDGGLNYIDPKPKNIFDVIGEVLKKKKRILEIFGNDYKTKDGTCIRDYVHVSDIADAHVKALMIKGSHVINLGSERGYSVLEIVKEFENMYNKKIPYKFINRREGDPAILIAKLGKAKNILKWMPKFGLEEMVESTFAVYNKKNEKRIKK